MSGTDHQRTSFLQVDALSYRVEDQRILSNVSFEMDAGERVAVFGPSGAGKSTLIRLMNRLDEPTSGTVFIQGQDYRKIPPRVLRRRLGLVMQEPHLFPGTVADNLRFGPQAHGEDLTTERIKVLLAGVDLKGFANREVSTLSGGEAQRVNLARTLANDPEVLLLDEPTSSLDEEARREVERTLLAVLESQSMTCLLVSHDREQVRRLADRVLLFEGGHLNADGSVEEVLDVSAVD